MDLIKGAERTIEESLVPAHLRCLVSTAERWAFSSIAEQDLFVCAMKRERPGELKEFCILYDLHQDAIQEWMRSIPKKHVAEMTENDWSHPVWAFSDLYKVREITGVGTESEAECQAKEQFQEELRQERFEEASFKANVAFNSKKYREFIDLLSSYTDLLSTVQLKKLKFAKRKIGDS